VTTTAKYFTKGRNGQKIRLIVIHTMECGQTIGKARQVLNWFQGKTSPQASAHYLTDPKQVFQLVDDADTAWAVADYELNEQSLSIELAGSASYTPALWATSYAKMELDLVAHLVATLSKKYGIPAVKLTPEEILAGKSGLCGHVDITVAKKIAGGHTDPGVSFPWAGFIARVESFLK